MANTITLYSISELLDKNFFIPSYQRGYRWDKQQVEDLLNDIYSFALKPKKSEKEFYCLQPIVVKKCNDEIKQRNKLQSDFDNNIWYEVIDGQQRLTTIRILISYLVNELYPGKTLYAEHKINPFVLEYETRTKSNNFIDEGRDSDETIDFFFITEARKSIKNWFDNSLQIKDPRKAKEKIRNTLIYSLDDQESEGVVQVIWYEIEDNPSGNAESNAIDTFIRINLGKIPLTNSELIKALFLQERKFYKDDEVQNEIAKLKQFQIATAWDRIENSMQNEDFWWFINEAENKIPAHIDFIFTLIKDVKISKDLEMKLRKEMSVDEINIRKKTHPTIEEIIGSDLNATFRYFYLNFENNIDFITLKKEWDQVEHYFLTLEEWYNNPIWYHYIGYLIYCGVPLLEIYNLTTYNSEKKQKIETKSEVTQALKERIKKHLKKVEWSINEDNVAFIDVPFSTKNKKLIREIILLYNIENIVKQCESKTLLYKFPFKTFKEIKNENQEKTSWDVEHIDSSTSNKLTDRPSQVIWLKFALDEIENNESNTILIEKIDDFITNDKSAQVFDFLRSQVIQLIGEDENDEDLKNSIGNLTLLDAGTNRGYGNALFPTKRKLIIKKDKLGVFIPICTKNVFLKYFDSTGSKNLKWTEKDIESYRIDIEEALQEFLPLKPKSTQEDEQI
jgi:uncharacterized protein with ParB-like and HNH nuclease domain